MRILFSLSVSLFCLIFIIGCGSGGSSPNTQDENESNSTLYADSIQVGALVWGEYTQEQIQFIANEPRIKLVSCLGNVNANDATLLKELNPNKPLLWFRTSINVGENVDGQAFYGFWTQESNGAPENLFFHYNAATIELVTDLAIELTLDPQTILPFNSRVIDSLWSTYIADPSQLDWQNFWREEVQKQVIQSGTFDGVRMDVFYEKLEGWTKPAISLTKEQLEALINDDSLPTTQEDFNETIEIIYSDRLPSNYDVNMFRSHMLELANGVKNELGDMQLALNPMRPSNDGTFEFYRQYAAIADILEIEMFTTKAGSNEESYQPLDIWEKQVGTMIWNELNSKSTLAFARGFSFDTNRRIYSLASYLLGQGEKTLFYYEALDYELSGETIGSWAQLSFLPEWEIRLGNALNNPQPHPQQDQDPRLLLEQYFNEDFGIYMREFENGLVLVNPSTQGQKSAYSFEKGVYLVQPFGGNVAQIHQMEDESVLEDERVGDIIRENPNLNENFNRIGGLGYNNISTIQLGPLEGAIILYEPSGN